MNKKPFNALNDFLSDIYLPIYIITKNYLFVKIKLSLRTKGDIIQSKTVYAVKYKPF